MIPVAAAPEPSTFNKKVRQKGHKFLSRTPSPTAEDWRKGSYWTACIPDLHHSYQSICAYTSFRIAKRSRDASVDHFTPKKSSLSLAYEWTNFRFASRRANEWKSTWSVVDPFKITSETCLLDYPTLQVVPNPALSHQTFQFVDESIARLHLNDDVYVDTRQEYIDLLRAGDISMMYLQREAPFLAYELVRLGKP